MICSKICFVNRAPGQLVGYCCCSCDVVCDWWSSECARRWFLDDVSRTAARQCSTAVCRRRQTTAARPLEETVSSVAHNPLKCSFPQHFVSFCNTRCSQRWLTSPRCRHLANWTKHARPFFILAYLVHYVKIWRRSKHRKYITYCIAVWGGPSHGHR